MSAIRPDLPVPPTTFVGREPELRALAAALGDARLVTIAGPGGCGKTRLAIEAAATEAARRRDGVCWADLTTTADTLVVAELVATAAGVLPAPDRDAIPSLARQLGDRRMLVCLDNCEHVVEAVAELAAELTHACPGVTVLATSREPLRVPGEVVWRVPPLGTEDAVALFEERSGPTSAPDRDAVRTACARLDGIPLAIELAAAWSGTLSAREILQGLDDRFSLLVRGPRGVAARHQTLAASMAWSHDLLEEDDQVLFRRLGAFHGGFTLEAARGVCAFGPLDRMAVLAGLGRLVDKSLVVADTHGSVARYRMLETVRAYAVARLEASPEEEADRVRDRHLDTYLALTDDARPLLARDKDAWRATVGAERENLCAAATWGLSRDDPGRGRRLLAGLPWLWHLNGRGHEGLELLRRAVARAPDDRTALQARLLTGLALVADTTHPVGPDHDTAQAALDIAVEAGDVATACLARLLRAVALFSADFDAAWSLAETARSEAREAGEEFVADGATALMGMIRHLRDEHDEAEDLFRTATEGLLRRGDRGVASTALGFWACGALYAGDVVRARALAAEAVETARPLADHHRVGSAAGVLATVETAAGRLDEARAALAPLVRLVEGAEQPPFVPGLARAMGELELRSGRPREAVAWFASETSWLGEGHEAALPPQTLIGLAAALHATGDDAAAASACERALAVARAVGMPRVTADALEQQARLADPADAERLHHEALALRAEHGLWLACVGGLDALARIAVAAGASTEATRLFSACDRARTDLGIAPVPADPGPRTALSETAYAAAWAEGGALDVRAAVEWARRARGPRRRPSSGWAGLTPAERSVVRLAAEGLSNPDIGARLFMSRSTVKTHLSHVYAKLGVTNRTELAALAVPHLAED